MSFLSRIIRLLTIFEMGSSSNIMKLFPSCLRINPIIRGFFAKNILHPTFVSFSFVLLFVLSCTSVPLGQNNVDNSNNKLNTTAINKGTEQSKYTVDSTIQLSREEIISLLEAEDRWQKLVLFIIIAIFIFILAGLTFLYLHIRRRRDAEYNKLLNNNASLKMQNIRNRLSPHFLINMLSGLSVDVDRPEIIKRNINTIAMLLRRSIENTEQTAIPLKEELEVVIGYIELQQQRIPQPFSFEYSISEGVNLEHLIPAMIIQIPVENAIKHGLLPMTGDKLLRINISPYEGGLQVLIEDNGIGMSVTSNRTSGTGIGLKVMVDTINLLNSKNAFKIVFSINSHKYNPVSKLGTLVEIKVPTNYSFDF